ncbi:MAG: hypothetical protein ACREUG_00905 [Steroidobacteraceae bacterium]
MALEPDPILIRMARSRLPGRSRLVLWVKVSGGCHLDRPIVPLVAASGFKIDRLPTDYMAGPKLMAFMYGGVGRPR